MISIKNLTIAFNSLNHAKSYVITIVITLGITLGALVATFNLNYQLLAAPLPYPNADRLVVFKSQQFQNEQEVTGRFAPYPALVEAYKNKNDLFERKVIMSYTDSIERRMPDSPVLNTIAVTPEYFDLFKVPLILGRFFQSDEGLDTHIPVTVISYKIWVKLFGKDQDVLGKIINIMEIEFKIIGVVDEGYVEPSISATGWEADVWLPFDYDDMPLEFQKNWRTSMNNIFVVGLLKSNADLLAAEHSEGTYINARFKDELTEFSVFNDYRLVVTLVNLKSKIIRNISKTSLLMLLGALGLIIIACANIINLMLARVSIQKRQLAIQAALGAQRKDIFNGIFAEIIWLITGSSIIAIGVASGLILLLKKIAYEQFPRLNELHIDITSILFVILIGLIMAFSFSYFISRKVNKQILYSVLQSSGKGVAFQVSAKTKNFLILSQITVTGILLVINMQLLLHSGHQLLKLPGLEIKNQYQIQLSRAVLFATNTKAERMAFFDAIVEKLRLNPKVERVSAEIGSPISRGEGWVRIIQKKSGDRFRISAMQTMSDGEFFNIVKMQLIAGRFYTQDDIRDKANFIVVNEALVNQLNFGNQVIGKKIYISGASEPSEIIGIVKNLNLPGDLEPPRFFWSIGTDYPDILLQMKPGQEFDAREMNQVAAQINRHMKVVYMKSIEQLLALQSAPLKIIVGISSVLALLVLGLAAIGIYGVLSYSVQLRRFELGIRMAIGARPHTVFFQVLKDNLAPVIIGLLLAFTVLIGLCLWVRHTQYDLQTTSLGWLLPPMLILLLTIAISLLSVWQIIRKPASETLRGI